MASPRRSDKSLVTRPADRSEAEKIKLDHLHLQVVKFLYNSYLMPKTLELPDVRTISLTASSPRCLLRQPTMIRAPRLARSRAVWEFVLGQFTEFENLHLWHLRQVLTDKYKFSDRAPKLLDMDLFSPQDQSHSWRQWWRPACHRASPCLCSYTSST